MHVVEDPQSGQLVDVSTEADKEPTIAGDMTAKDLVEQVRVS
jgi:hypothetical protein